MKIMETLGHACAYTRMRTYASCMRTHTRAYMHMLGF